MRLAFTVILVKATVGPFLMNTISARYPDKEFPTYVNNIESIEMKLSFSSHSMHVHHVWYNQCDLVKENTN